MTKQNSNKKHKADDKQPNSLFTQPANLWSFINHVKHETELSDEWNDFFQENQVLKAMIPGIKQNLISMKAKLYFKQGRKAHENGFYLSATKFYSKAIEIDKRFAQAYFNRGSAYISLNYLSRAESDFAMVLTLNPELFLHCMTEEFPDFSGLVEDPIKEADRKTFAQQHLEVAGVITASKGYRGDSAEMNSGSKYFIKPGAPLGGFVSLTGKIQFNLSIEARSKYLEKPGTIAVDIFRTEMISKMPVSFEYKDIEIKENGKFEILKEIYIGENGVYNWYLHINKNEILCQGMFKVLMCKPNEEDLLTLVRKVISKFESYSDLYLEDETFSSILKDISNKISQGNKNAILFGLNQLALRIQQLQEKYGTEIDEPKKKETDENFEPLW